MRETPPAYELVAQRLRTMIVTGQLAADDRLPSEALLCERFGVGRSTVREALRQLSSNGLVVTSRGVTGGTRVARGSTEELGEMLNVGVALLSASDGAGVGELLEAREFLEVPAARLAALRRTTVHLDAMDGTIQRLRPGVSMRRVFEANRAFHEAVFDASGNRILNLISEPVFKVLQTRFLRDRGKPEFWTAVIVDHTAVLKAIRAQDVDAAGAEMAKHLAHLRVTYERSDLAERVGRPKK